MKLIKLNNKALSNIIGALMLTLIVVTAATSFALFTSQKQEEIQKAELTQLQRDLENIEIMTMQNPTYVTNKLESVEFKISNIHSEKTTITTIYLNNEILERFKLERHNLNKEWWDMDLTNGTYKRAGLYALDTQVPPEPYIFNDNNENHQYDIGETILDYDPDNDLTDAIPANEQIGGLYAEDATNKPFIFQDLINDDRLYTNPGDVIVDNDPDNNGPATPLGGEDGYRNTITDTSKIELESREYTTLKIEKISKDLLKTTDIFTNDAIILKIYTELRNDFEKIFIPPTAIIQITTESQWDPSIPGFTDFIILDGSSSDHPGEGSIKTWTWDITEQPVGTGDPPTTLTGRKVRAPVFLTDTDTYNIDLTVEDNYGMTGTSTLTYP